MGPVSAGSRLNAVESAIPADLDAGPAKDQAPLSLLERWEFNLLSRIPLPIYQRSIQRDAIGLVYHAVSAEPLPHLKHLYPYKTPEMFDQDLLYLQNHCNLISYEQFLAHSRGEARLKPNSILLTFDDGYAECFSVVRPILQRRGVPCIFFIATDFIDNQTMFYRNKISLCLERIGALTGRQARAVLAEAERACGRPLANRDELSRWARALGPDQEGELAELCRILEIDPDYILRIRPIYLRREEIRALADDGFTIGAHSRRHVRFSRLSPWDIEAEILGSCREIMEITGRAHVPFAFPFSGYGVDRSLLAALLARHEFLGLLFDVQGLHRDRSFIVNRIWADPPARRAEGGSNLDRLLRDAYRDYVIWRRRAAQNALARWFAHGES